MADKSSNLTEHYSRKLKHDPVDCALSAEKGKNSFAHVWFAPIRIGSLFTYEKKKKRASIYETFFMRIERLNSKERYNLQSN